MLYGRTPFGHIKNKISKSLAIVTDSTEIPFPDTVNKDALDIMKVGFNRNCGKTGIDCCSCTRQRCLIRHPKKRPTIDELLSHPYSTDS